MSDFDLDRIDISPLCFVLPSDAHALTAVADSLPAAKSDEEIKWVFKPAISGPFVESRMKMLGNEEVYRMGEAQARINDADDLDHPHTRYCVELKGFVTQLWLFAWW